MTRENGVVAVPKGYFFKMAKMDYNDWEKALPREFFQNSVDAGATRIEVEFDEEKRMIRVSDNGCGMDYSTIKDKLLVLGGSKKAVGNVGAFGKAKEILFFSWDLYSIVTRDWLVKGEGAEYSIEQVEDWYDGTLCSIKLWKDVNINSVKNEFEYIASLYEVSCDIYIDGRKVDTQLRRKELIRAMKWGRLYIDRENTSSYRFHVRINGQWMFSEWMSSMKEVGQLIVEINANSTDALTSNRDSLKGEYQQEFRKLIEEFITETKSAMEPEKVIVREKFTGTGKVAVDADKLAERFKEILRQMANYSGDEVADRLIDAMPEQNVTTVDMDRIMETVSRGDYWDYRDRYRFIGFQPDFHVIYDKKDKPGRIHRFMRGSNASKLANAWTEVLKQVFLDIEEYIEFNVGFNFSLVTTASYEKRDGDHYFYLNPDLLLSDCEGDLKWYRNRNLLREDLILKAIHEITHAYYNSHNEDFVLKSEWIRARTWKSSGIYPRIIKECFATT